MTTTYVAPQYYTVAYPAGKQVLSEGRNGYVMTSGVHITVEEAHVQLRPITSKGQPAARCRIRIPADRDALLALADQLQAIATRM